MSDICISVVTEIILQLSCATTLMDINGKLGIETPVNVSADCNRSLLKWYWQAWNYSAHRCAIQIFEKFPNGELNNLKVMSLLYLKWFI